MTNSKQISVYFPDHTVIRGKTASQVLLAIGKKQWKYHDKLASIKRMLSVRAYNWSGVDIDPNLPSPEFLKALGESGMVFVWYGDEDPFVGLPS